MPLIDQMREQKLIELARERFSQEDLKPAELKVLHDSASSEDLPEPDEDAPRPEIRAAFIRWLATDPETAPNIDPKGLRVYAATIPDKLDFEGCHIGFRLDFRRCEFKGEIKLRSAETRGVYILDSSLAEGIRADPVIVHGPLFLLRMQSNGEIRLRGAEITGQLACSGAKLKATGNALSADGAKISGNVFLDQGFESEGAIRLLGAQITGQLGCSGAKLKTKGNALHADRVKIGGSVFLLQGFESEGEIRLLGAQIGGDLTFLGAKVAGVSCKNMQVKGDLIWQGIEKSIGFRLDLTGAKVKNLRDDKNSWPAKGNLDLDGLVYEELTLHDPPTKEQIQNIRYGNELPLVAKERIEWLMLQPPNRRTEPQPWMQLAKHLEAKGDHKGAKHVLYRLRRLEAGNREWHPWQWMRETLSRFVRILALLVSLRKLWPYLRHPNRVLATAFAWLEEAPLRILYSIALFLILGWLIFSHAGASGALAPTEAEAYKAFTAGKPMPAAYPKLNPLVYTLENAVPLVRLGQDEKWAPDQQYPGTTWFTNYWFLMWARWLLILSGWFQATVLAAALSGRFKQ